MRNIYLFPGLGADHRIFEQYSFPGHHKVVMSWKQPAQEESLAQYANRYLSEIKEESPILLGVSFGGMIASTLKSQIPASQLILISSVSHPKYLPSIYRLFRSLRIAKWLPIKWMLQPNIIVEIMFGAKGRETKRILSDILYQTDPDFLRWSINAILNWQMKQEVSPVLQIHGDKDLILTSSPNNTEIIRGGGHLAVMENSSEIERLINDLLTRV